MLLLWNRGKSGRGKELMLLKRDYKDALHRHSQLGMKNVTWNVVEDHY